MTDPPRRRRHDRPRPLDSPRRLDLVHRVGAVVFGLGLWAFGILGLVDRLDLFSTRGEPVLGLSSNGLLSIVSLVVGALLIAAAVRGGRMASTVLVGVGAAFLLSGVANVLVLTTPSNILAFTTSNVIFSLLAGFVLLTLGAWGRFTGRLPSSNPYERERHPGAGDELPPTRGPRSGDADASVDLAAAERAVAAGVGTPDQIAGVRAAAASRGAEDRLAGWRTDRPSDPTTGA